MCPPYCLKCVVTEVLFSVVAFMSIMTLTFHKVVQWHTWGVVGFFSVSIITNFLLILTAKEVWKFVSIWWSHKAYKNVPFLGHPVVTKGAMWLQRTLARRRANSHVRQPDRRRGARVSARRGQSKSHSTRERLPLHGRLSTVSQLRRRHQVEFRIFSPTTSSVQWWTL